MHKNMAYNVYSQNSTHTESPQKLIEMLYEGVLRFNAQAKKALEDGDIEKKIHYINRSSAIVMELLTILDFNHGRVAYYLDGLYKYQLESLSHAASAKNTKKLDEVSRVFKGLLEAWREIHSVAKES